jgi:microsomal dipeptidase-like Zn-dependent dipeptidase
VTIQRKVFACWAVPIAVAVVGAAACCGSHPPPDEPHGGSTPPTASTAVTASPPPSGPITGWVDLHAHPLSNLGFAGKLVYGGVDAEPAGGALLPADPSCNENVRATSVGQALGHDGSTHGSWGVDLDPLDLLSGKGGITNPCGDTIREAVISAVQTVNDANNPPGDADGYPDFGLWPRWNDITHQSMYIDWIKRAHDAGLNVMVALAVNNETLADTVAGPGDGPDDDMASADLQVREIQALVARHADWMEIAYRSADVARIVVAGKLALVLGLEVDNIGDFNRRPGFSEADVRAELSRLRGNGVRYLFPIHLIDNPFGTTAAYMDIFNLSNLREAGHFWNLQCAKPDDHVTYKYTMGNPLTQAVELQPASLLFAEMAALMVVKLGMLSDTFDPPVVPTNCPPGVGMLNVGAPYPGLTPMGTFAIQEMMRQGMLIDIDHMSQAARVDALALAAKEGYPVNSGHNSVRGDTGDERSLRASEYAVIGSVHGMSAVGGATTDDEEWAARYQGIVAAMAGAPAGAVGFGTDADGMARLMRAPAAHHLDYTSAFPKSTLQGASWDYNDAGVAHYGMLADFVKALPAVDGGAGAVAGLMKSAQYFVDTWAKAEAYAAAHAADGGSPSALAAPAAPQVLARSPAAVGAPSPCAAGTAYNQSCQQCLAPRGRCELPRPACDSARHRDHWGLCMKQGATGRRAPASATAGAPGGPSLAAGEYTLVLAAKTAPGTAGSARASAEGFDVDVTSSGRRISLRSHGAHAAADPASGGGFRGDRFIVRLDVGDQVLVLVGRTGRTAPAGPLTQVQGSFVAHAPSQDREQEPLMGAFVLKKTSTMAKQANGLHALADVKPFLTQLRP